MEKIKGISTIIMYLVIALFISSCSNTPSTLEMVPKSSPFVSVVNVGSLLKKGHMDSMDNIKEFKFFKKFKRIIAKDGQLKKIYKSIEEDPAVTGVDFSGDLVTFAHVFSKDEVYMCNAFELNDSDEFEKFLKEIMRRSQKEYDIEEDDGINYMIIGSAEYVKAIICWDSDRALISVSPSRVNLSVFKGEVTDLMNLKSDDNITNNDSFSDFLSKRKDASVWFSVDNLNNSVGGSGLYPSYYLPRGLSKQMSKFIGKEICFSMHLDFDNENIKLSTNISHEGSLEELNLYNKDFNSDILKYLPKDSYFMSGISLDVNKVNSYFGAQKEYLKILDEMSKKLKIDGDAFLNSLGGSAVFNVHSYEKVKYSYLGYGYSFDETKAKKFDKLYPIGDVSYLSDRAKEKLNKGETISVTVRGKPYKGYEVIKREKLGINILNTTDDVEEISFTRQSSRNEYSMNIKNILAKGGTVETAITNNSLVNFYEGGLEYGKNVENTIEKELPLYAFITDLKDSKVITELFNSEKISEQFSKKDGYYKLNSALIYVSIQQNTFLVTNDIKVVTKHKNGGFSDNLGDSPLAANLSDNPFYSNMNFDYDTYSDTVKNNLESEFKKGFTTKAYDLVFEFIKTVELKTIDTENSELIINTQNTDENSLYNLIKAIDKGTSSLY